MFQAAGGCPKAARGNLWLQLFYYKNISSIMSPLSGYPPLGLPKTSEQFLPFWWITSLAFDCFSFWLIGLSFLVFGKESVTNLVEDAIAIPTTWNGPNSWLDELDAESTRRDAETETRLHRASPQSPTVHLFSLTANVTKNGDWEPVNF